MHEVKYNGQENRIYVKLEGFIKYDEAVAYKNECQIQHKKLKSGATFLMDARELKTLPQNSMEEIQITRAHAVEHGIVKGAMILNNNILAMQAKRTAKHIEGFYEEYFTDINEAENYLNKTNENK
jgi:hypothetical protein